MGGREVTVRTSITRGGVVAGGGEGKNRGMNECSGKGGGGFDIV